MNVFSETNEDKTKKVSKKFLLNTFVNRDYFGNQFNAVKRLLSTTSRLIERLKAKFVCIFANALFFYFVFSLFSSSIFHGALSSFSR